jgi:hypothetical protein
VEPDAAKRGAYGQYATARQEAPRKAKASLTSVPARVAGDSSSSDFSFQIRQPQVDILDDLQEASHRLGGLCGGGNRFFFNRGQCRPQRADLLGYLTGVSVLYGELFCLHLTSYTNLVPNAMTYRNESIAAIPYCVRSMEAVIMTFVMMR